MSPVNDDTKSMPNTFRYPETFMLEGGPKCKTVNNAILTEEGEEVKLLGATGRVLKEIASANEWKDTGVAYVSRTDDVKWANEMLSMIKTTSQLTMDEQSKIKVRLMD